MRATTYVQLLVQASEVVTVGKSAGSAATIAIVAAAVPITIFVVVVCALAWRSMGLPSAGQAYTLTLLDRLARLGRALWLGNPGGRS